jgi:hypothetical protein
MDTYMDTRADGLVLCQFDQPIREVSGNSGAVQTGRFFRFPAMADDGCDTDLTWQVE